MKKRELAPDVRAQIQAEFDAFVQSTPPPRGLADAYAEIASRTETPTGIHRIEELRAAERSRTLDAIAPRLAAAEAFRVAVLKWFAVVSAGVAITVIGAAILWVVATLAKVR